LKNTNIFWWGTFRQLKAKLPVFLPLPKETSENCRTGFPWCLAASFQMSSENIERKKSYGTFSIELIS